MRRLTYKNSRGEQIIFYLSPFLIESLEGIGEVGATIQSQTAPYQDGDTYIDTTLDPRFIDLEGSIATKDRVAIRKYRREISRVCNPKLGLGLLTLELDGDLKQIEAVLDGGVVFPEREQDPWQPFMITFKCPNPYWKSPIINEEPMSAFVGLFELPSDEYWEVGEDGDLYFEVGYEGERRELFVEGDAPVPIEITFYGPLLNPTLRNNTTGEMIRVRRRLEEGDELVINTEEKTVLLNGEDVFHWIDIDSEFWSLQVGANEVEYFADEGMDDAKLEIRWQDRFVAV